MERSHNSCYVYLSITSRENLNNREGQTDNTTRITSFYSVAVDLNFNYKRPLQRALIMGSKRAIGFAQLSWPPGTLIRRKFIRFE